MARRADGRLEEALHAAEEEAHVYLPQKVFDTLEEAKNKPDHNVPVKLALKGIASKSLPLAKSLASTGL